MTFIDQTILPVFILWFVSLILVMFRRDIDLLWKFSFLFCFIVYLVVFGNEWSRGLDRLEENPGLEVRNWILGMGKLTFYLLYFLWPISLLRMFYSGSTELVRQTAVLLVSFTIVFWFVFWLYHQYQDLVDKFLSVTLVEYFR